MPISAEFDILRTCARARLAPAHRDRLQSLLGGCVDWPGLLRLANLHKLGPLLHHHLKPVANLVPEDIRAQLAQAYMDNARHNLLLLAELRRVLDSFQSRGIQAVPFKGPLLAIALYGDAAMRQCVDLDILVRRRDLPVAGEILVSLGYRIALQTKWPADSVRLRTEYHFPFVKQHGPVAIEVHAELTPYYFAFPIHQEEARSRLFDVQVNRAAIPTLGPEDLLLFLCAHGTKHLWSWLEMIGSFAEHVRSHPEIHWESVRAKAARLGGSRMLLLSLLVAERFTGLELPAWATAACDPEASELVNWVERFYGPASRLPVEAEKAWFHLRCRERLRDRIRYLLLLWLAPNWDELEFLPLPRALFPLYWVIRPLRLSVKSAALAIRAR